MPASVVYSHNGTGDTRHTPKPRLSTFVLTERERKMDEETDRGTCSRHARSQEEGLCLLWCLRWTKSASEAQKLPLPPPPLPPALKILIHHSTVAPWLLWSLSVTLTALPTTMHAFFAVLQTQLRNNYKAEGLRYVDTTSHTHIKITERMMMREREITWCNRLQVINCVSWKVKCLSMTSTFITQL